MVARFNADLANQLGNLFSRVATVVGKKCGGVAPRAQEGSPLEETIGREALARYVAALARLEPEERDVIIGRVEMEYSYAELADLLGKPTADAARKAARRALLRLAEEMKP